MQPGVTSSSPAVRRPDVGPVTSNRPAVATLCDAY